MSDPDEFYRVFSVEYYNEYLDVELLESIPASSESEAIEIFNEECDGTIESIEEAFCINISKVERIFGELESFS